jgi:carnitine O-acetyltransferase
MEIEKEVEVCYTAFKEEILNNETSTLNFINFGGTFIKAHNLSPDAFVQIGMQLAYYKMFGTSVATYGM